MAVITPSTDVILLKVPLEISDINQLTFANATAQYNYFFNLPKLTFDSFTYQRKDETIRVPALVDDLYQYNYVMYRNSAYSNKWFYAYITSLNWVSDQVTSIGIKTDVWQTWQFDLTYKRVFVEREHTNNDTIGANLEPENLETGEFVSNGTMSQMAFKNFRYVINATYEPYGNTKYAGVNAYGIPIGGALFVFDYWPQMVNALQGYANNGHLESIAQVYVVPYVSFNDDDLEFHGDDDEHAYWLFTGGTTPQTRTVTIARPNTLNGYTPRNNKLLTGEYQSILVTNNNGSTTTIPYEYFTSPSACVFEGKSIPTVGGTTFAYPKNYKGLENNYNESLMGGKYPTLSWSGDGYTNWLTQNAVNINAGVVTDVVGSTLAAATGHYLAYSAASVVLSDARAGTNLFGGITGTLGQIRQHAMVAQTIRGNVNGGDIITSDKINDIMFYPMSITSEFAQIIDSYFDMFGYKTNKVKIPNVTGRTNWNFVKTQGCYIQADIPQEDLQEIKSMFDKGITFWHNPSTFMDYSQTNAIVTP